MAIGLSATFLLYGALTAMLVVTMFIIIGMIWLNSRIQRLEEMFSEMWETMERILQRLEPNHEDLPRG